MLGRKRGKVWMLAGAVVCLLVILLAATLANQGSRRAVLDAVRRIRAPNTLVEGNPLISRNVPASSNFSDYPPARANDGDYSTVWNSIATPTEQRPAWLAYDLSGVPAARRQTLDVAWYNGTGDYYQPDGATFYNLPRDYTLEANSAPGGGEAPAQGWKTLVRVTGNTYSARVHRVAFGGASWLRISVTRVNGSPENMGAALQMDVFDTASLGNDTWLFAGDSITRDGMAPANAATGPWPDGSYQQLINVQRPTRYPLVIDGGIGGMTMSWAAQHQDIIFAGYSPHFVAISFGTNDENEDYLHSPEQVGEYYANLLRVVDGALARGMTPVVPFVPWGCSGQLGANAQAVNDYVSAHLLKDRPQVIRGPNLWKLFHDHPTYIGKDCIHPTLQAAPGQLSGYEAYQRAWRDTMLATVYRAG
ncbi:MAG TPA: GDSL-type esterase/lipase family protein [Ktedonobacterales bacterium]